jgi:hypothetical protein
MNILTKLSSTLRDTEQSELDTSGIVNMQNHLRVMEYRRPSSFVLYSSRRIRSQLNT